MRFGIMDMQMAALVPPGLSPENALAHLAGFCGPIALCSWAPSGGAQG